MKKSAIDSIINNWTVNSKRVKKVGRCPYHEEKTPSCAYDSVKDTFYCFGCGKEGDGLALSTQINKQK